MPVDPAILDVRQTPETVPLERGRVRSFAATIGETSPLYLDDEAARAAGHPDLLVPPTFLFGLELEHSDTFDVLRRHSVALSSVLHGEQAFTYHRQLHAGDVVTFSARFTETYSKAGGALDFVVRETAVTGGDGELVAELRSVTVIQNGRK